MSAVDRFLKYVSINTKSDEDSHCHPSTICQKDLAEVLVDELNQIGASNVFYDEEHCYVYARIPATCDCSKKLGFISHMDTSPEASGENVRTNIVKNYDGTDIVLNPDRNIVLSTSKYPEIKKYIGLDIITTDGTTLLGADDKAGIAEIMQMAEILLNDLKHDEPKCLHGEISIAFTPDEEIGEGTEYFDLDRFDADYAYTVDGGAIGELEYENFNAASVCLGVNGVNIHPGDAKNKMINAALIVNEFNSMLPSNEIPSRTEGYEGFYHLTSISGDVTFAEAKYIIRDHSRETFELRKAKVKQIVDDLNDKYGADTVTLELKDQYYNMREIIENGNKFLIDLAESSMKELDITPIIKPIRGGTDGAMLSFKGLPCPNICTGGHNFHGVYEYCPAQSIEKITDLLINISTNLKSFI